MSFTQAPHDASSDERRKQPDKANEACPEVHNDQQESTASNWKLDPDCIFIMSRIAVGSFAEVRASFILPCVLCWKPVQVVRHALMRGVLIEAAPQHVQVFAGRFNGALVVIKIVLRVESALQACFKTEAPRLASLRHPNLLRMIGENITCTASIPRTDLVLST